MTRSGVPLRAPRSANGCARAASASSKDARGADRGPARRLAGVASVARFVAIALALATAASPAAAQRHPAGSAAPAAKDKDKDAPKDPKDEGASAKAQQHFARARELYQQGSYREAIGELEAAHQLDPGAKDLVFNLAVVSEKLGKIDEALAYMRQYGQMDLDANERGKADAAIRRLEGAKKEMAAAAPAPAAPPEPAPAPAPPPPQPAPAPRPVVADASHGRLDALTVTAAVLAVGGAAVGTVFGLKAMGDRPSSGFVTGRDGAYTDLQSRATHAHHEAQIADVGFAVAAVSAVATLILYFARTSSPEPETVGTSAPAAPLVARAAAPAAIERVGRPAPASLALFVGGMRITW